MQCVLVKVADGSRGDSGGLNPEIGMIRRRACSFALPGAAPVGGKGYLEPLDSRLSRRCSPPTAVAVLSEAAQAGRSRPHREAWGQPWHAGRCTPSKYRFRIAYVDTRRSVHALDRFVERYNLPPYRYGTSQRSARSQHSPGTVCSVLGRLCREASTLYPGGWHDADARAVEILR
jgi:hypothetical protein